MTTPVPATWSEAYCEQCGVRADLTAAGRAKGGGWRATPLRTCPDCGLLTCRSCWHARSTRCERCFVARTSGTSPVATPPEVVPDQAVVAEPAPDQPAEQEDAPTQPAPLPPEPVLRPAPRPVASLRPRPAHPSRAIAAIAAVLVLVVTGAAAFLILPGRSQREIGVAAITARPSSPAETDATAEPQTSIRPAESAAPRPANATPPRVELVDAVVTSWIDDLGEVRAHVVATVENRGGAAARLPGSESSFTIRDGEGASVAGGLFGHAFPPVVEPGERAYLIDTLSATFADPEEVVDVEVEVVFESTTDTIRDIEVANVTWDSGPDGLVVTGDVENGGEDEIGSAAVAVVLQDARSRVLGAVYDVTDVAALEPGASVRFSTAYPGLPPIEPGQIAAPVVVAFEQP
jgi:hypothetical protein